VRTVVSTNFVFGGRNGKTNFVFHARPHLCPLPRKRILASMVQVVRLTVRQIRADAVWQRWLDEAGGGTIQHDRRRACL
jgi:hypothetical protein